MRIFLTGASGWIGSAVVPELLGAGHEVVGLARSDDSAARVAALGAEVRRGSLDDPDGLAAAASESDGVVHLGYNHDFSRMDAAARTDRAAIDAMGDTLADTGRPLVIASGTLGLAVGRPATERDAVDPNGHPRLANSVAALALADRGVRSAVVRFAPTVHGPGDPGFMAVLVATAREKGVSAYIGDGANRWPAVQRLDAATLVRLVVEQAAPGGVAHAVAEEGVPTREIAAAIGRQLGLETVSIPPEQAADHFSWLAQFFSADVPASSALTRETLGWNPTQQGLLAELDDGVYTS